MITYTRKNALPPHMCDVAKALDDMWDGAYEIEMGQRNIVVRNPATGREVSIRHIPGFRSSDTSVLVPLSAPTVEGEVPEIDWDEAGDQDMSPLMRAARRCAQAHVTELRVGEAYETVALSEAEQALLDEELAASLRKEGHAFLLVGSVPEELVVVPASKGWVSAVLEFSLGHPACTDGFSTYALLASRLGYFKGCLARLGVPADAVESDGPRTDRATGKPVVDVRLRKSALEAAGVKLERRGRSESLRLADDLLCSLAPKRDCYSVRIVDTSGAKIRIPVVTRMRPAARLARLQGGKALRDTKGAIRLDAAIG